MNHAVASRRSHISSDGKRTAAVMALFVGRKGSLLSNIDKKGRNARISEGEHRSEEASKAA